MIFRVIKPPARTWKTLKIINKKWFLTEKLVGMADPADTLG
jgi:hypothetical protein